MEAKLLTNTLLLLFIFVQECLGYCNSSYEDCDNGFEIWRVWYLWVVIIIVISLCCGGCGAYRRRRLMMQQQQGQVIVGPVVTVPTGQVNYGYNQGTAAPMAPPSYSAAAASPATYPPPGGTTYPPPAGATYPPPAGSTYPPPAGTTYPPTSPSAPAATPMYNTYGNPDSAENKSALPNEPPPAYTEAVKHTP